MFNDYMQWGMIPYNVLEQGEQYRLLSYAFAHTEPIHAIVECLLAIILSILFIKTFKFTRFVIIWLVSIVGNGLLLLICTEPYQATIGASSFILALLCCLVVHYRHRLIYVLPLFLMCVVELVVSCMVPYTSLTSHLCGAALGIGFGLLWRRVDLSVKSPVS